VVYLSLTTAFATAPESGAVVAHLGAFGRRLITPETLIAPLVTVCANGRSHKILVVLILWVCISGVKRGIFTRNATICCSVIQFGIGLVSERIIDSQQRHRRAQSVEQSKLFLSRY